MQEIQEMQERPCGRRAEVPCNGHRLIRRALVARSVLRGRGRFGALRLHALFSVLRGASAPLVLLTSSGFFHVIAEDRQSHGRADLVAETPDRVFVFELKVDGAPQEALDQIKEKGYAEPYRHSGKEVHLIGLSFDGQTRHLSGTAAERLIG